MKKIQNPILKGFNPDPSILRVGSDYYIAVSTFEWFTGVYIYHSRDLVNWEFVSSPLNSDEKMNLIGIDSACGIWAPNLTYNNGKFYLLYTIVYTNRSRYKDTHNFLITAHSIEGPWSEPVFLNCSGFDPSLFHDEDKKWVVNMTIDHRTNKERFSGIVVQEYDETKQQLVGEVHKIFKGTEIGKTEGPNIMKQNGYYYLTAAEGGTEFGHCVTVARSKSVTGPYEVDPHNPMLTSKTTSDYPIQRAGHGQLVDTPDGKWYMAHLCSRPVDGYSILGRETALQNIIWDESGWFRLEKGGNLPQEYFEVPEEIWYNPEEISQREDFNDEKIPWYFMTLREAPKNCKIMLGEREGWLRIYGGNSLSSKYKQGFLARRQQNFTYEAMTKMEFDPRTHHHMAGMAAYYNYDNYHYLKVSKDEELGLCINVTTAKNAELIESEYMSLPSDVNHIYLKAKVNQEKLNFYYSIDNQEFHQVGETLDMRILSDEHVEGNGFTGAMIGICCQDLRGDGVWVDFDWFEYQGI